MPHAEIGPDGLIVTPEYDRAHLFGGTFAKAFGPLTLRGRLRSMAFIDLGDQFVALMLAPRRISPARIRRHAWAKSAGFKPPCRSADARSQRAPA